MRLNRANYSATKPPVRMVHLGLGAFFRAHQAWYTSASDSLGEWGIAAFTGRSPEAAQVLTEQDGLYTLIVRGPETDSFEVIGSLVAAHASDDLPALLAYFESADLAVVTLTITEAGYSTAPNGAIARLALALNHRRSTNGLGLALVPCDNLPENGSLLRAHLTELFAQFGSDAQQWLTEKVSFVSTSIDRITPKTTAADTATVERECGWEDLSCVVTEPFHDWVLEGEFPLGRPAWELAGAKFVSHLEPFENRKLWLLNGSHSILAYLGSLRGHQSVSQAIADPECRLAVTEFWDEAERTLDNADLDIPAYRAALLERFENPRIAHQLSQIAIDGATKLRLRIVPTALAELKRGASATGAANAISAWVAYLLNATTIADSRAAELSAILADTKLDDSQRVADLVAILSPELAANPDFLTRVHNNADSLTSQKKEEVNA